jgi:hydroxypyruvate isomerase
MPRFAANLSMLFTDAPFLDRFARARQAGFDAVEFLFPYDFPAEEIRRRLDEHRLQLVLHNLPAGQWASGERGIAGHPDRVDEFRSGVVQALRYAQALGVGQLNCLAGKRPAGVDDPLLQRTLLDNLRFAADALGEVGLNLLVEPINHFDIPGFCLSHSAQTIALLDAVDRPNVFLQYDVYHMQRMEGELAATIERLLPRIGHIQVADNPGRHEPGTGEIAFPFLFALLDRIGYAGWVGCEYAPATSTEAGLDWRARLAA